MDIPSLNGLAGSKQGLTKDLTAIHMWAAYIPAFAAIAVFFETFKGQML